MAGLVDLIAEADEDEIERQLARLNAIKGGAPRALAGAINDLLKGSRTHMARGVRDKVRIKYGRVLRAFAVRRATPTSVWGKVASSAKDRLGLMNFGAEQTDTGVSYQIEKTGGRKQLRQAFIARGRGSVLRVFRRIRKSAYPIRDKKGPSINAVARRHGLHKEAAEDARKKLPARVRARVQLLIDQSAFKSLVATKPITA